MKEKIATMLNLTETEFNYEENVDIEDGVNEVIIWGDRIDTIVISMENLI